MKYKSSVFIIEGFYKDLKGYLYSEVHEAGGFFWSKSILIGYDVFIPEERIIIRALCSEIRELKND